jgi:hypothetical protein
MNNRGHRSIRVIPSTGKHRGRSKPPGRSSRSDLSIGSPTDVNGDRRPCRDARSGRGALLHDKVRIPFLAVAEVDQVDRQADGVGSEGEVVSDRSAAVPTRSGTRIEESARDKTASPPTTTPMASATERTRRRLGRRRLISSVGSGVPLSTSSLGRRPSPVHPAISRLNLTIR